MEGHTLLLWMTMLWVRNPSGTLKSLPGWEALLFARCRPSFTWFVIRIQADLVPSTVGVYTLLLARIESRDGGDLVIGERKIENLYVLCDPARVG